MVALDLEMIAQNLIWLYNFGVRFYYFSLFYFLYFAQFLLSAPIELLLKTCKNAIKAF